jgi:predicted TIM-barrel fold metal-dependent hydrolase
MRKIDIHCHTTNRKLNGARKKATLDVILENMNKYEIERTVLLASYFPHRSSGISNFRLLRWISNSKASYRFYMFGSLDFENYFNQGINELNELNQLGKLNGIKIYTCYQNISLKSDNMNQLMKFASKNNLLVMFHCGYSYMARKRYGKPAITQMVKASDLEFLAKEHDTNFIFSHMSKPFFNEIIKATKENKNIYTDMSGLIDSKLNQDEKKHSAEQIKKFLNKSGPEKLMFGTDFPVQTHEDSIQMIETAMSDFQESDKKLVYYENAKRLFENEKN